MQPVLGGRSPTGKSVRVRRLDDGRPERDPQPGNDVSAVSADTAIEFDWHRVAAVEQVVQPVSNQKRFAGERGPVQGRIGDGCVEGYKSVANSRFIGRVEESGVQPIGSSVLNSQRPCAWSRRFTREIGA